jgi:hypothetical protein
LDLRRCQWRTTAKPLWRQSDQTGNVTEMGVVGNKTGAKFQCSCGDPNIIGRNRCSVFLECADQYAVALGYLMADGDNFYTGEIKKFNQSGSIPVATRPQQKTSV